MEGDAWMRLLALVENVLKKWLEATENRRSGFGLGFTLAEPQIARCPTPAPARPFGLALEDMRFNQFTAEVV